MPLLDLQRRAVEVGRIRIGAKVPTSNGKTRPAKLGVLRFTSRDEVAIRAVAELYGGEPRHWQDAPTDDQWEVITTSKEIPVAVPPGPQALSQWYELWSGGGCQRRCDGVTEQINDKPCMCGPDQSRRACKPTTRVSIILPDIPGLGVWRLQSGGWNAAHELGATAELLAAVRASGVIVPAVLRLEQRQSVADGKTMQYAVPVLALRHTMRELTGMQSGQVELPPAPAHLRAIEATAPRESGASAAPDAPQVPAVPTTARDMAAAAEACESKAALVELGREAQRREWMDTYVPSKYAPADDEDIELVEVFRGRQAELEDDAP